MQCSTGFKTSQTILMAKKLQDKLIPLSEKCVLQSSGAKKSVAWGGGRGGGGAFFLLQATLFFAPLHLAACSQANRKIVLSFFSLDASKTNRQKTNKQDKNETRSSSISPQFFSSSLRAIQIVLPRETDWLDRAG